MQRRPWLLDLTSLNKELFLFPLALFFSLLAALRLLGIDRDFDQYRIFFDDLSFPYDGRFELGFVYFSFVIKRSFGSFFALLFFVALLSLVVKFYLILKLPNSWYWLIVYLLVLFPLHEMTQMRVAIAIAFGYLALYLFTNRVGSVWPFLLLFIASMFQYSILILMPFFIFSKYVKYFDWRILLFLIFSPAILVFNSIEYASFLNPIIFWELNSIGEYSTNPFSILNISLISVVAIGISYANNFPASKLPWLYLSAMGLGLYYGLMEIPVFAHRLLELTIFSYFFWIPYLPKIRRYFAMTIFSVLATYIFAKSIIIDPLFS